MSQTAGLGQPGRLPLRETRPSTYRAYRAPQADREVLAIPPLDEAARFLAADPAQRPITTDSLRLPVPPELAPPVELAQAAPPAKLASPQEQAQQAAGPPARLLVGAVRGAPCIVGGRELAELRATARPAALALALRYVSQYCDVPPPSRGKLLVAGHQPELFHPGVWLKNFALGKLARATGSTPLNLVVDTDVVKHASIRVPAGNPASPHVERLAYDTAAPAVPFEERCLVDRALFASFGLRVAQTIAPLVPDPSVTVFWPMVQSAARETDRLGLCLSQARHLWERRWGLETLELPLSHTCRLPVFAWFVVHLLVEHEAFRRIYNEAVLDYRRAHRIRSENHPVPLLAQEDEWLETPFWTWTADNPQRRRLFVRRARGGLRLADRHGWELELPLSRDGTPDRAVAELNLAEERGIHIRTRALSTTLFARLLLADMFVHGIGGAKYDQITDRILSGFFGVPAAPVLVVSATLRLPVPRPGTTRQQLREVEALLRNLRYHGEHHLDARWPLPWTPVQPSTSCSNPACGTDLEKLAARKRALLAQAPPAGSRRQWCQEIRQVNEAMFALLAPLYRQAQAERQRILQDLAADAILASREYAFCLYPEHVLRDFLLEFLHGRL